MIRKPQTVANVVIGFTLVNSSGGNAVSEAANITAIITGPTGAAVTGFTAPTITETAHAGNYIAVFASTAPNKAFTSSDNANPYHVSFDSSTAGIDPTGIIEVEIGTQLIDTDTEVDGLTTAVAALNSLLQTVNNSVNLLPTADAIIAQALPEPASYPAAGAAPTIAEALHIIIAVLTRLSATGTTATAKKADGTTAMTFTVAPTVSTPASIIRTA